MNILYLYPDLLNLHGDKANMLAIENIAKKMKLKINIDRIDSFEEKIEYKKYDLMFISPGELMLIKPIVQRLKKDKKQIKEYLKANKYIICIGTSGAIFANEITRHEETYKGLNIGDFDVIERHKILGDDLIFKYDKQLIVGSQIQMIDFVLHKDNYLGKIEYGHGNNGTGYEGIKYNNLIITNTLGPLLIKNPWLTEKILKDIANKKQIKLNYKKMDYNLEIKSQKEIVKFNLNK
jgi:CobQ-like glutamine amidotransferase family enzyme